MLFVSLARFTPDSVLCWLSHNKKNLTGSGFQNAAGWRCYASYPAYKIQFVGLISEAQSGNSVVAACMFLQSIKAKTPPGGGVLKVVKLTDKPGSVVDSHSSRPAIAHWLKQPTRVQYGPYLMNPYLALLRVEFTVPRTVTSRAVRSYRTLSPLPDPAYAGHRRFALCCTGRGFPPQALPGTLPNGARTLLPTAPLPRKGRRRSGDCLVSFGAKYRGFACPCHPALRIPTASVAAMFRDAR